MQRPFRIIFVFALLVALVDAPHLAADAPAADSHVVVMISVDGLAAYYLDDPKADMPTLRKLAAEGARASAMKASTPTVTWPNHTTLVTGDNPARHGVVGNTYFDRATLKKVTLISDPVYDKDEIVKVPTLYDKAKAAGITTAAVRWPATRNAKALDWTCPDVRTADLFTKYSTPGLIDGAKAEGINILDRKSTGAKNMFDGRDDVFTKLFDMILHEHRPGLALLHNLDVDHTEHEFGPKSPEAYAAVKDADNYVREVFEELQRDFPGRATLVVVSDHGFSPIRTQIFPNIILRKAGMLGKGSPVHAISQGGSEFIYITDASKRASLTEEIRKAFSGVKGIQKIVDASQFGDYGVAHPSVDPHAPDVILFADEGYSFGDTSSGSVSFNEKPERKGTHGHDASIPDLHATFIAWGAGVKPGVNLGEISNVDVAPTIAKLLGIELPDTDGKPLTGMLSK